MDFAILFASRGFRMLKIIFYKKIYLTTLVSCLVLLASYCLYEHMRNPLQAIDYIDTNIRLINQKTQLDAVMAGNRKYREIQLNSEMTE